MTYELRQVVKLVAFDEHGTITSRVESTKGQPMYQVLDQAADTR